MAHKHSNFTHSVVKNRSTNTVIAKFLHADHAKAYCTQLNIKIQKKQFHWHETTGSM